VRERHDCLEERDHDALVEVLAAGVAKALPETEVHRRERDDEERLPDRLRRMTVLLARRGVPFRSPTPNQLGRPTLSRACFLATLKNVVMSPASRCGHETGQRPGSFRTASRQRSTTAHESATTAYASAMSGYASAITAPLSALDTAVSAEECAVVGFLTAVIALHGRRDPRLVRRHRRCVRRSRRSWPS
jgi:hypothetical protein